MNIASKRIKFSIFQCTSQHFQSMQPESGTNAEDLDIVANRTGRQLRTKRQKKE